MKFKKPIEVEAGISDGDPLFPLGQSGYLLSSDGSNVSWVSPGGLSAETAEAIVQPIKANEALTKGDPLYIVGYQLGQDVNIVAKADSSDVAKMPVVGLADDDYANQAFGTMTAFGSFNGAFDTSGGTEGWSVGDIIFVKPLGGLTNIKPGGTDLIQNVAIVSRVSTQTGELEVIALGRTNDVPNLPTGRLFVGTAANTSLASDVVYVDDTNDRVGIGTTNPSTDLEVSSTGVNGVDISQSASNASQSGRLFFTTNTASEGFALFNSNGTFQVNSGGIPNNTSGTNRISIVGSTGNVGIGTTSPNYKLEVSGTLGVNRTDGIIFAGSAAAGLGNKITSDTSNNFIFSTSLPSIPYATSTRMTILNNGNVGIGTTSPDTKLEVSSSSGGVLRLTSTDTSVATGESIGRVEFKSNDFSTGGNNVVGFVDCLATNPGSSYALTFGTGNAAAATERMRISQSGSVGIGTTSPTVELQVGNFGGLETPEIIVAGGISSQIQLRTTNATGSFAQVGFGGSQFANSNTAGKIKYTHTSQTSPTLDVMSFRVNYSDRMVINGLGNVGIGTTSPGGKLEINGGIGVATTGGTFILRQDGNAATDGIAITSSNAASHRIWKDANGKLNIGSSSLPSSLVQDLSGNVGIGTTSPSEKLEVAGSVKATASTDAYKGYIKQSIACIATEKAASANYNLIPYNTLSTTTSNQYYNRMVAAYDGRIKKVYIRDTGGNTPTASVVNIKKQVNDVTSSTVYSTTVTGSGAGMSAVRDFADNDFTFSAGDSFGILYQTTDSGGGAQTMGGVAINIIIEYNIT